MKGMHGGRSILGSVSALATLVGILAAVTALAQSSGGDPVSDQPSRPGLDTVVIVPRVLVTPPIYGEFGYFFCQALNVSNATLNVNVSMFDYNGEQVGGTWCMESPLQPGQVCASPFISVDIKSVYCKFSFFGNKEALRGTLQFIKYDDSGVAKSIFAFEAH